MPIQMRCCHLKHKGEVWMLDLGDESAIIRDSGGNIRSNYTRDEAAGQFLFPSFSESIKQFRMPIDGEIWHFDVGRDDLKQIRAYIDQAVVAIGPEAVRAVRNRAIRETLIGIGAFGVGAALTIGSFYHAAQQKDGREYFISFGAILFGLVMIGKGVYGFMRYAHLQKLSRTEVDGRTKG